jgi:hypothetical protein
VAKNGEGEVACALSVPGQAWSSSFSLRKRFRLMVQMVAAAASKRRRISIFSQTPFRQFRRDVEGFGFAVHHYGDLMLRVQLLAVGAVTVGPTSGTFASDKRAGSISRRAPRLRTSLPRNSKSGSRGDFT